MTNNKDSHLLLNNLSFCAIDLETTGGNHKYDKIIEIGLVRIEKLKITEKLGHLIEPKIPIPEFIQRLTTITPQILKGAPTIDNVIDEILDFIGESILVAHNAQFDIPFINSMLTRLNRPLLKNKSICTNLMTKFLIPDIMNSNLNYMSKIFNIPHEKAHRALEDAIASAHLLLTYLDCFQEKNIQKVNHLYYPRNKYELDRINIRKDKNEVVPFNKISRLSTPLSITIKGEKGVFLANIPIKNPATEINLLKELLQTLDWKIVTIKMIGSFFEALFIFNNNFNKFDSDVQKKLLKYLQETHAPLTDSTIKQNSSFQYPDFLIINHLIPEQFIIYPLLNLNINSGLIFRYPGHKKKLLQYINNQKNKFEGKLKQTRRSCIQKPLVNFFASYLWPAHDDKQFMFFSSDLLKKDLSIFLKELHSFLAKNPNTHNYPQKHI